MGRFTAGAPRQVWIYGTLAFIVGVGATLIVVAFISRGAIRVAATTTPLPKVVVVAREGSGLADAWLAALAEAGLDAVAVTPERYQPAQDLLVLCSVEVDHPVLASEIRRRIDDGGGIILTGAVPPQASSLLRAEVSEGAISDPQLVVTERPSPLLARIRPGFRAAAAPTRHPVLEEHRAVSVDARWAAPARAAIAHWTVGRARVAWFGFRPSRDELEEVPMLAVLTRAALRWTVGQPVSDGAAGPTRDVATFSERARINAQDLGFGFSAEPAGDDQIELLVVNRGEQALENPRVRLWLPPGWDRVALRTPIFTRKEARLTAAGSGGALDVHLPALAPLEERRYRITKE